MKQKHPSHISDKYDISALLEQISQASLMTWTENKLKKDKGLRIELLTHFASKIENIDIRGKYLGLYREIKTFYGKGLDSKKKTKGKEFYSLFNDLLYQAQDQLALGNYRECYEIIYAAHSFLYSMYLKNQLNETGIHCLQRIYELTSHLSHSDLPPPLVEIIIHDWMTLIDSGQFKIFHVDYNPFALLFKVFDDEELLFEYFRAEIRGKKYSEEGYRALKLLFIYAHLNDISGEKLNYYLEFMHPLQLKRIFGDIISEKKQDLQKYILENISTSGENRLQLILLKEWYNYYKETKDIAASWDCLVRLLKLQLNDENINLLLDFVKDNAVHMEEDWVSHLRKLTKKMTQEQQWELLYLMDRTDDLKKSLLKEKELLHIIPFLKYMKKEDEAEILQYFKATILEYLRNYYGKQSVAYVEEVMRELKKYGHRDIQYKLMHALEVNYSSRPSIKLYLTDNPF